MDWQSPEPGSRKSGRHYCEGLGHYGGRWLDSGWEVLSESPTERP